MSDIVERLRARKGFFSNGGAWMMSAGPDADCAEAASEIEALRKEAHQVKELAFGCYLALSVLRTMCRKINLTLAENKTAEIMTELDTAFPGFAARSALR